MGRKKGSINKSDQNRIRKIEQEYHIPFNTLLKDFLRPDYMDKHLGVRDIAKVLGFDEHTIHKYLKKAGIKISGYGSTTFIPTPTEDLCWVERGLTMEQFIRRATAMWLTTEEIAILLHCEMDLVKSYAISHKIPLNRYVRGKEERGIERTKPWRRGI